MKFVIKYENFPAQICLVIVVTRITLHVLSLTACVDAVKTDVRLT